MTSLPFRGDSPRGGEMPAGQRGPLSTRGTVVRRWRGSSWNLLHSVKGLWKHPSVTCGDSSPKGEPIIHKGEPDNKASPLGEGNQRSWWRGSCGIFCFMYQISQKYPSVTCGDSSAQGTPCGCPKGEPMHQKGAYKKIPATFSPQLPRNVTRYTIFRENVSNSRKSWE